MNARSLPLSPRGWLAAGLLMIMLLAGCTTPAPERGLQADPHLVELTQKLIGDANRPDDVTTRAVFGRLGTSVRDMSTLSVSAFAKRYHRGPSDQATLVGQWLGVAAKTVDGPVIKSQLVAAATTAPLSFAVPEQATAADVVAAVTGELVARAPNEPSDNPKNRNAHLLRSTIQQGFVSGRS